MNEATQLRLSLLLCVVMAFGCIFTYISTKPIRTTQKALGLQQAQINEGQENLRALLRRTAREDNTVIITEMMWRQSNSSSTTLDLFLESFQIGEQIRDLSRHVIILAADTFSFDQCKSKHPSNGSCLLLPSDDDDEQSFKVMTPTSRDLQLRWRRLECLRTVLHLGYNLIFTELDVMWFRRPFLHFQSNVHLIISAANDFAGDSDHVIVDGGFMYAKSCEQTIAFYDYWLFLWRQHPGLSEQSALSRTLDDTRQPLLLKVQFLEATYFAGFCQLTSHRRLRRGFDLSKICVVHANCCGDGYNSSEKDHDLGVLLQGWKNYTMTMSTSKRKHAREDLAWRVPNKCKIYTLN